jgi:hypothetical protein
MKNMLQIIALAGIVAAGSLLAGCELTKSQTTINTPAVYNVTKDATGAVQTNLVSPASVTSEVKKERLWLPDGYALMLEQDLVGIDVECSSPSSATALPNVKFGQVHGSQRWLPTSTNQIYAPSLSVSGSADNKAVPFWVSNKGAFTSGNARTTQETDTNGVSSENSAIVPGTPAGQQK